MNSPTLKVKKNKLIKSKPLLKKIKKAAGLIIENKKLLVERSENCNYFKIPGGTLNNEEKFKQALVRELKEELNTNINEDDTEFFTKFNFKTDKYVIEMKVYLIKKYKGNIKPGNEVQQLGWACKNTYKNYSLGSSIEKNLIRILLNKNIL